MPKGYHHLTYEQRCQIEALLKRGITQLEIAKDLIISQSSVSREVSRNKGKRGYRHKQAHRFAIVRSKESRARPKKLNFELSVQVEALLSERQWSPAQISGRLKKIGINLSHELIYQHVWADKHCGGKLYLNLRNRGKKYTPRSRRCAGRGMIPNRVGIEHRPKIVDEKVRVGDLELDTIVGAKHKGAIVSIVDRRTKVTWLQLVSRATADLTSQAIIKLLSPIKSFVHTLTPDNGKEFARHEATAEALDAKFYFANPYSAWERGLNENHNRLVRQYFPKGTDFTTLSHAEVKYVEFLLNTRPRETLDFKTPIEVFRHLTQQDLYYALRG
jgi:IS30 family transposase